jgi:hypothetical protein
MRAKAAARGMAALFCPIEAAQYSLALIERDTRTGIADLNALTVVVGTAWQLPSSGDLNLPGTLKPVLTLREASDSATES